MKRHYLYAIVIISFVSFSFIYQSDNIKDSENLSFMKYDKLIKLKGGCADCIGIDCCTPCTEYSWNYGWGYYYTSGPTRARVGSNPLCDYYYDCFYESGSCYMCDIIAPAYIGIPCY